MITGNMSELKKIIEQSAESVHSKLNGMPNLNSKEDNISKNLKWRVKHFIIVEQMGADEYADFMTTLIQNQNKYTIIREKETWTQAGEMIKLVEYLEKD